MRIFARKRNVNRFNVLAIIFILLSSVYAKGTPQNISFQSRIYKPDGNPLEAANVQFKFSLMNPLSTCVLYSETFPSVDMTGSSGSVVLALGNGTRSYPVAGGMRWYDAFDNSTPSYTCESSGTFSPALIDPRRLVMQFNDGAGWQTLPPMDINSVPYAMFAQTAETVPLTGLPQGGAVTGQVLKWNGTSWAASSDDTAGGGAVISTSSANAYLTITNPNTTPSFTVNVGTGTNTVAAGDDSRIVGAFQSATALSGDLTGTLPGPTLKVIGAGGTGVKITYDTKGRVLSSTGLTSSDVTTALGFTPISSYTITSADITSALGFTPANASHVLNSGDITTALGYVPTDSLAQWVKTASSDLGYLSGNIGIKTLSPVSALSNTTNNITGSDAVGISTDSLAWAHANAGYVGGFFNSNTSLANANGVAIKVANNASTVRALDISYGVTQAAAGTPLLTVLGNGNVGIGIQAPGYALDISGDVNVTGNFKVNGVTFTGGGGGMSSDLTSASIFVGNASNIAQGQVLSGDATLSNLGILTFNNSATARGHLGLGTVAVYNVAVTGDAAVGEVVKGDDSRLTNGRAPSGAASGDLSGTYPNPTLKAIGAGGTGYKITYDTKGRVTGATGLVSADITAALGFTPGVSQWVTNSSDISYTIGKVGIGTPAPTHALDVVGSSASVVSTFTSTGAASAINFRNSDVAGDTVGIGADSTSLVARTGNFERFRIDDSGNVGIGTSLPLNPLHVEKNFNGETAILVKNTTDGGGSTASLIAQSAGTGFAQFGAGAPSVAAAGALYADRALVYSQMTNGMVLATEYSTPIVFATNATEQMRIMGSGHVGVGVVNPGYTMDVSGDVNVTGAFRVNGTPISGGLSTSLNSARIYVGNGSNIAQSQVLSGDATISNTGILSLVGNATSRSNLGLGTSATLNVPGAGDASTIQVVKGDDTRLTNSRAPAGTASGDLSGSYPSPTLAAIGAGGTGIKITFDTKGRVTGTSAMVSSDITTALGFTPATLPSQTGNSGKVLSTNGTTPSWITSTASQWATSSTDITYAAGKVGVGSASTPQTTLDVTGQIKGGFVSHSSLNTNFNSGNIQTTNVAAGTLTFTSGSMFDGGSYTLILTAAGTFTLNNTGDITTWRCMPACGSNQIAATGHTVITILKAGTTGYVSWIAGF